MRSIFSVLQSGSLLVLLAAATSSSAAPVKAKFSGHVTQVFLNTNNILGALSGGEPFVGEAVYDSEATDYNSQSNEGSYVGFPGSVSVLLNGTPYEYQGTFLYVHVYDNLSFGDQFTIAADGVYGDFGYGFFGPELTDSTKTALGDTSLPMSIDLGDFDSRLFKFSGGRLSTQENFSIQGEITSFEVVPEPGAVALLLSALVIGVFRGRQR
jgi:hypothetical protein